MRKRRNTYAKGKEGAQAKCNRDNDLDFEVALVAVLELVAPGRILGDIERHQGACMQKVDEDLGQRK
jgi:hypothetical protein